MLTLIAATTNKHKLIEIQKLMCDINIKLKSLSDYSGYPDVIEDGKTFEENALKKARAYFNHFGLPVFADDSGLVVPALNNEPGVYSARYAGEHASYADNNKLLMKKIKKVDPNSRQGIFVCTICYKDDSHEKLLTGTTEGIILDELRGEGGFGYDPLFYLPGLNKCFAELSMEKKNDLSHRGKATIMLKEYLKNTILDG